MYFWFTVAEPAVVVKPKRDEEVAVASKSSALPSSRYSPIVSPARPSPATESLSQAIISPAPAPGKGKPAPSLNPFDNDDYPVEYNPFGEDDDDVTS